MYVCMYVCMFSPKCKKERKKDLDRTLFLGMCPKKKRACDMKDNILCIYIYMCVCVCVKSLPIPHSKMSTLFASKTFFPSFADCSAHVCISSLGFQWKEDNIIASCLDALCVKW